MIVSIGRAKVSDVVAAARLMGAGLTARHEYAQVGPTGAPGGITHLDGWGLVFAADDGTLRCYRSATGITADDAVEAFPEETSDVIVAHVRNATNPDQIGMRFVHPIEFEISGNPAFFFHNGFAPDILGSACGSSDWDSLNLLEWLKPAIEADDTTDALERRLGLLPPTTTSANFVLVQSGRLIICNWFDSSTRTPEYYTMHRCDGPNRIVISSEPIPDIEDVGTWQPLGNRTLLEIPFATFGDHEQLRPHY
ncbi:MAG TPA: hypothetical protein VES88_11385 [Gemmatimonadaceae bacterium]|nr:hypothetical protein [Gemmatimonadaceae bacterium]